MGDKRLARWISQVLFVVIVVVGAALPASGQTPAPAPAVPAAALFGDAGSVQERFRFDRVRRRLSTSAIRMPESVSARTVPLTREPHVRAEQSQSDEMSRRMQVVLLSVRTLRWWHGWAFRCGWFDSDCWR